MDISGVWEHHRQDWLARYTIKQSGNSITGNFESGKASNGAWTDKPTYVGSLSGSVDGNSVSLVVFYSEPWSSQARGPDIENWTITGPNEIDTKRDTASPAILKRVSS